MNRNLFIEAEHLIKYFERRELYPAESCTVMSFAIVSLINDRRAAREYVRFLAKKLDEYTSQDSEEEPQ